MTSLLNFQQSIPVFLRQSRNPFARMQMTLDKTMDDFYDAFELPATAKKAFENLAITPDINIVDDKDHFKIEVEMPGMGEEDIQVAVHENILTIKGEKKISKQNKDKNYLVREINYGSYQRRIQLPDSVDVNKARVTFKKGMLWIEIPKQVEALKESQILKVEKV